MFGFMWMIGGIAFVTASQKNEYLSKREITFLFASTLSRVLDGAVQSVAVSKLSELRVLALQATSYDIASSGSCASV